jgi:hypothetical protein
VPCGSFWNMLASTPREGANGPIAGRTSCVAETLRRWLTPGGTRSGRVTGIDQRERKRIKVRERETANCAKPKRSS